MSKRSIFYKACQGCGKPVVFARDLQGKWQILDLRAPVWVLEQTADGEFVAKKALKEGEGETESKENQTAVRALVSHFSVCSHANDFSQSKKGETP